MNIRQQFVATVEDLLAQDPRLVLLLGDIGVFGFRNAFAKFPGRVVNIGILEQATVSFAAGLAREGFIPVFHSIAPFVVERAFEQLKVDFGYQRLPGCFVSVGASFDYASLGCTHHCPGDVALMQQVPGMRIVAPGNSVEFDTLFRESYSGGPTYFRLSERAHAQEGAVNFGRARVVRTGRRATIVVAAQLLEQALSATAGLDVTVLHYTTLAPFDRETLAGHASRTVIVVEPFYTGTLAGEVSAALSEHPARIISLGVPRQFLTNYGKLGDHERACGLDADGLRERIDKVLHDRA
ncbi:MAG: transketolase C-terminal domain-containing protein [Limisphaerales bacterium]